MSSHDIPFTEALRRHGYSLTAARRRVFDVLSSNEPLSMGELVAAVGSDVDRTSVYRTIGLFEQLGIVQRLQIGWKYKLELSNAFQEHHHHMACTHCGAIIPLPEDEQLESRIAALSAASHFQADDHQIEIRGLCSTCQIHRKIKI